MSKIEHGPGALPAEKVMILDFGSQYTQLIARKIRELNVYAEIVPFDVPVEEIKREKPSVIILSGGPSSIYDDDSPRVDRELFNLDVPMLGICYGLYVVVDAYGGKIEYSSKREYGRATVDVEKG